MQKEFINVAAHELRTPIQPILGLSEILRSRLSKGQEWQGRDLLDIIIRNAKRLQRLAEDILDVTRIESQSLKLKKELFDLNQIASQSVEDHRNQITSSYRDSTDNDKHISLVFVPDNEEILIEADKSRISQVISNLLSNAIKFTKLEKTEDAKTTTRENYVKTILVTVAKDNLEKEAIVGIRDAGIGIDPEIIPRLFSKFASKSFEGTGLGLFISKSIIEAHGGKIWAENNESNGYCDGATFRFTLALYETKHQDVQTAIDS
jgi:signal transduction histidine kinase